MQEKLFLQSTGRSVLCLNYPYHKNVAYAKRVILIICVLFLLGLPSLEAKENASVENHKKDHILYTSDLLPQQRK